MTAELPVGWCWTTLGALCDVKGGLTKGKRRKSTDRLHEVPYLRVANVQRGFLDLTVVRTIEATEEEIAQLRLIPGDVLLNEGGDRDKLGRGWIWAGEIDECIHQNHVFRARPLSPDVQPKLLSWYGNSEGKRYFFKEGAQTTNLASINLTKLRGLPVPLPPGVEQRRIVAHLDSYFTRLDDAVTSLERVTRNLERYRASVLRTAVEGRLVPTEAELARQECRDYESATVLLDRVDTPPRPSRFRSRSKSVIEGHAALAVGNPDTELPEGWAWTQLADVARLESGHTPSRQHPEWWGGDIPWIGIKDARAHHRGVIHQTSQNTNEEGLTNSAARLLPAGTVCLSRTASVGYVVILGRPMATSQDFVNWICTEAVDPRWLACVLMADRDALLGFGKGTVHTTIYFPEVLSFHIAIPPLAEQGRIVEETDRLLSMVDVAQHAVASNEGRASRLRQAILGWAFEGKLVDQDLADEPASALLDRITAEREAAEANRAKRKTRRKKKTST